MATQRKSTKLDGHFSMPDSVTIYQIADLHKRLLSLSISRQQILDFAITNEIDSSGIQLLMAFEVHCKQSGSNLVFENVSDEIAQLLDLFHCQFQITSSNSEAERR